MPFIGVHSYYLLYSLILGNKGTMVADKTFIRDSHIVKFASCFQFK